MNEAAVAETPAKQICRPAKPTVKVACGERRECVPDNTGAMALFQPFPTEGPLFDNLDLPKPELERLIGGLPNDEQFVFSDSPQLGIMKWISRQTPPSHLPMPSTLCNDDFPACRATGDMLRSKT